MWRNRYACKSTALASAQDGLRCVRASAWERKAVNGGFVHLLAKSTATPDQPQEHEKLDGHILGVLNAARTLSSAHRQSIPRFTGFIIRVVWRDRCRCRSWCTAARSRQSERSVPADGAWR